jgi:hypothetical protein
MVVLIIGLAVPAFGAGATGPVAAQELLARRSSPSRIERTVSIYAAVIRELVARDRAFGVSATGVVYVLDGSVDGAGNPLRAVTVHPQRFKSALKRRLRKALADLPALRFVHNRAEVVTGDPPGHVINNGVLLTLGPIKGGSARVEVGSSLWVNGLAGQWQTYVVVEAGRRWKLAGTTGPVAIS